MQANKRLTPATPLTATALYTNLNITTVAAALEKYQQVKEQLLIDCQMQRGLPGRCTVQDTNKTAVTLVLQLNMTHVCN